MTEKKEIKQSEAKIMVYLSVVHPTRKHVTAIANKLEIDYSYVLRVLQSMVAKGWLRKHQYRRHMFYDLTQNTPIEQAKNSLVAQNLQMDLIQNNFTQEELTEQVKNDTQDQQEM